MRKDDPPSPPTPWISQKGRPPAANSTGEIRTCSRHGEVEFHRYRAGKRGFRWRCKRCVGEAVTRRHQQVRRILVAEAGGGCAVCGYDRCMLSLHFHHVDPQTKSFGMTAAAGKSEAAYKAELRKCVLVCANCHGEIEAGIIECPPAGTKYGLT